MTRMIGFSGVCASLFATLALSVVAQASPPPPAFVPAAAPSPKSDVAALSPDGTFQCPDGKTYKVAWEVAVTGAPVWKQKSAKGTKPVPPANLFAQKGKKDGKKYIAVVQGSTRGLDPLDQLCLNARRGEIASDPSTWNEFGVYGVAAGVTLTSDWVAVYYVDYDSAKRQHEAKMASITTVAVDNDPDKDGILGAEDRCPTIPGVKDNQGCPDNDTDGDKIVDRLDKCPNEPGIAPDGCPAPKAETPKAAAEPAPAAVAVPVTAPKAPQPEITTISKPDALAVYIGVMTKINALQPGQFAPCAELGVQWNRVGGVRRLTLGADANFCYANTGLPAVRTHGVSGGLNAYVAGVLASWLDIALFGGYDESRSLTEFNYTTIRSGLAGLQFDGFFFKSGSKSLMIQLRNAAAGGFGENPGFPVAKVRAGYFGSLSVLYRW